MIDLVYNYKIQELDCSYTMAQGYKRSLSPAQIQYLKINPKIGASESSKKLLIDALIEEKMGTLEQTSGVSSLNKIPKLTYGQFEKTVSNFGVLLNKNFGNETIMHQTQKFGMLAKNVNKIMQQQKDKPLYNEKQNALMKKVKDRSDNRTFIKSIYDFEGEKIYVTLKSFTIQGTNGQKTMDGLPIPYLKFLVTHVNSSRLTKTIENAMKTQGNQIVVEFDKIQSRASHFSNNQVKYQNIPYNFQRMGQQLTVILPSIQFNHIQTDFNQSVHIENKEILQILQSNFDNVGTIVQKYFDFNKMKSLRNLNSIEQADQNEEQNKRDNENEKQDNEENHENEEDYENHENYDNEGDDGE